MADYLGELTASVQAKVDADTDFQSSIATLSDEEKTQKIAERMSSDLNTELQSLRTKADSADKANELADNYKRRAEKAEKAERPHLRQQKEGELTTKDVLYLAKENLHEEDQEMLLKYAKANDISLQDARKDLKGVFDVKNQERTSAAAIHTSGSARGISKPSGADILEKARQTGEVPDDEEGLSALFDARRAQKIRKREKL